MTDRKPTVVVLCGALMIIMGTGICQTYGLFLQPISSDLVLGREVCSFAMVLQSLISGLPLFGTLADRYGPRWLVQGGATLYGAGFLLLSRIASAIGLYLTSAVGWQITFSILAAILSVVVFLAFGFPGHSKVTGAQSEGDRHKSLSLPQILVKARAHSGFWLLTSGFFVCGFQVTFIGTHLPAFLADNGISKMIGASTLSLIGLFNIFGSNFWIPLACHGTSDQQNGGADIRLPLPVHAQRHCFFQPPTRPFSGGLARGAALRLHRFVHNRLDHGNRPWYFRWNYAFAHQGQTDRADR